MTNLSTPSKMSLEIYDIKTEMVFPNGDLSVDELLRRFCSMLISHTFCPKTVIDALKDVSEDLEESFSL